MKLYPCGKCSNILVILYNCICFAYTRGGEGRGIFFSKKMLLTHWRSHVASANSNCSRDVFPICWERGCPVRVGEGRETREVYSSWPGKTKASFFSLMLFAWKQVSRGRQMGLVLPSLGSPSKALPPGLPTWDRTAALSILFLVPSPLQWEPSHSEGIFLQCSSLPCLTSLRGHSVMYYQNYLFLTKP